MSRVEFNDKVRFITSPEILELINSKWPQLVMLLKSHPVALVYAIRSSIKYFYNNEYLINWSFDGNDGQKDSLKDFLERIEHRLGMQPVQKRDDKLEDILATQRYFNPSTYKRVEFFGRKGDLLENTENIVICEIRGRIIKACIKAYRDKLPHWTGFSTNTANFEINHTEQNHIDHYEINNVLIMWNMTGSFESCDKFGLSGWETSISGDPDLIVIALDIEILNKIEEQIKSDKHRDWAQEFRDQAISDGVMAESFDHY